MLDDDVPQKMTDSISCKHANEKTKNNFQIIWKRHYLSNSHYHNYAMHLIFTDNSTHNRNDFKKGTTVAM